MQSDIKELLKKFYKIKKLGYVKSQRQGHTGIGYTFEKLIGKEEESFCIPDFNSIEIKTKHKYGKQDLTLITAEPDSEIVSPVKQLVEKYGYADKNMPKYKILNIPLSTTSSTYLGNNIFFKLQVNNKKERIELIIVKNKIKMQTNIYWTFQMLQERIERKLKHLAIVFANSKQIKKEEYLYYNEINFYKLKSFNTFISLVENGDIKIYIRTGIFKSGKRIGELKNRGTCFKIAISNIEKLYTKICIKGIDY